MSKIYTKTGDAGMTGLLGGGRVAKDDLRIETYGTVDELNAVLGLARASAIDDASDAMLGQIQDDLFVAGSALADPDPDGPFHSAIGPGHVERLERAIDAMDAELPRLTQFIMPGGMPAAAQVHFARTVCRRAERLAVKLAHEPGQDVTGPLLIYLNRLSDFLFVLARMLNHRAGVEDVPWRGI